MVALVALVLILALFGGLGFAARVLWYVLLVAVLLWLILRRSRGGRPAPLVWALVALACAAPLGS
jgi:hypothetical protein